MTITESSPLYDLVLDGWNASSGPAFRVTCAKTIMGARVTIILDRTTATYEIKNPGAVVSEDIYRAFECLSRFGYADEGQP